MAYLRILNIRHFYPFRRCATSIYIFSILKKWFGYIILLFCLAIGANWLYTSNRFFIDVNNFADQYLQIHKVQHADIIYLSASSNFGPADGTEEHPLKISQLLGELLTDNIRVEAINKPAAHANCFLHYLQTLPNTAEVETIVVAINLRSFGPDWRHSELETSLQQANVFYNKRPAILNRLLLSLKAYDNLSTQERQALRDEEWAEIQLPYKAPRNTVNSWCGVEKWGDWKNPKRQLADQFIKQFGFVVNEQNPRVDDFDKIIDWANTTNKYLVLHILPENLQLADALVGSELTALIRQNKDWLLDRFKSEGIVIIDNLELLPDKHFRDRDFPTEHYDLAGRQLIAKTIYNQAFK